MAVENSTDSRIPAPLRPNASALTSPARNDPASPTPMVAHMLMGSRPGSASRASAPTRRPVISSMMMYTIVLIGDGPTRTATYEPARIAGDGVRHRSQAERPLG